MKLKPLEFFFIFIAILFGISAVLFQQIESDSSAHDEELFATESAPSEFFVDAETIEPTDLDVNEPEAASQTVQQFFTLFKQINTDSNNAQALMQARSLLTEKLQLNISDDQTQATRDLSRQVGTLTPIREFTILRIEQTEPQTIDVIVEVTTDSNQKTQKRISTIQEDNLQKIDSITILE